MIGRLWAVWQAAISEREPGTALALVRIGVGLAVAGDLAVFAGSGGMALMWGDMRDTAEGFRTFSEGGLLGWLGGARWETVQRLSLVTGLAALLMAAGLWPGAMAFIALQGCIALYGINPMVGGGHDRVATNALWLLCWAQSGQTLSAGCRWRTRQATGGGRWRDDTPIPAWPRWLMILQLCLIYTTTGVQKLSPEWMPWGGLRAVYNMLLVPIWARWDLAPWLGFAGPLLMAATAISLLWEVSFGLVGLWLVRRWWRERYGIASGIASEAQTGLRDLRTGYAALGALFHLTLWGLTSLGPFSPLMLALYPALFRQQDWHGRTDQGMKAPSTTS